MNVYDNPTSLGIDLPTVAIPAAADAPYVQNVNLIFVSGTIARQDGSAWVGQLEKMSIEDARSASWRPCVQPRGN